MSSQAGAPNTDAVSISQLLSTVWSINAECVEKNPPNVGGWESLGMYGHGIEVHVYQIGSEIDRLIKIKSAPPNSRPAGISSFSGSSGTSSPTSSTGSTATSGDSDSTVNQPSPSKRIRVCSSPVKCTDAATNYICNWKNPNVAQTVLEVIYGSLSTFANHQLAVCVAA
ncbi:MAG: hypothetical protein M1835_000819 [Candelina submexicana]|nr:MAG: hypothetical protein M1835_000819 [Candelina submexicana]